MNIKSQVLRELRGAPGISQGKKKSVEYSCLRAIKTEISKICIGDGIVKGIRFW